MSTYLRVVRRRKWIILACTILVPLAAYFVTARQESQYQASAQVYLSSQDIAGALTGISASYVDEQRLADTQSALAQVPAVARRAVEIAGVSGISPDALLGSTSVVPGNNTNILTFTVTNHDPQLAMRLATAYARAFTKYRGELDSDAVRRARTEIKQRLDQLTSSGQSETKLAVSLRDKDQQLATLEALQTSRTYVIRTADGAGKVAPTPRRNALIGLMLGLVLGLGLAFAIDALDTRVRSASEVGEFLGIPLLARVPPPPKAVAKADQLVMVAQPTGPSAEAFRMLRANIDFATLQSEHSRSILVTSAGEGEGKSTTAANLAVAEARAGRKVALVDLDLRVPYLDRFFGLTHAEGLTDVALGTISLQSALRRINFGTGDSTRAVSNAIAPNGQGHEDGFLDVLVSGPRPPDPGEFVGARQLVNILAQLQTAYDIVIIDTPPLLRVSDAMTLSSYVDGILVVVNLSSARRPVLSELHRVLRTSPTRSLGFVLTGSRDGKDSSYGYGYDYGGYGYREEPPRGTTVLRADETVNGSEAASSPSEGARQAEGTGDRWAT